jgi:hypothetical protein
MATSLSFTLQGRSGPGPTVSVDRLVVAGWTGRDAAAVQHHIEELLHIGVPAPSQVPLYYRIAIQQLTQAESVQVLGPNTSGEVEPVVFEHGGAMHVTVGSDHTDRELERAGVAVSKQACAKVVGRDAWALDEVIGHWDRLVLRSWITEGGERVAYQEGGVAGIRPVSELIAGARRELGVPPDTRPMLPPGCLMFCGTLGAIGGIRPSAQFEMELHDPVLDRSIRHTYRTDPLPVVA